MECPKCGSEFVPLRRDEQATRSITVISQWLVCHHCQHVSLGAWTLVESSDNAGAEPPDLAQIDGQTP
jgi:hypothetical protein